MHGSVVKISRVASQETAVHDTVAPAKARCVDPAACPAPCFILDVLAGCTLCPARRGR